MLKIKKFNRLWIIVSLAVCGLFCMLFMGNAATATYADEGPQETPVEDELPSEETRDENGLKSLVDGFIARLKAKYGDDYETYYNAILAEWGSVEEYLLSLADKSPDAAANGWKNFVKFLDTYKSIWMPILAVAALATVILLGKKFFKKIINIIVEKIFQRLKNIGSELNKIEESQIVQNAAIEKLLGVNKRFEDERESLRNSSEELKKDG